jgi:hypothetical protein
VLLPVTETPVPTVVPPEVQVLGAVGVGPNTVKVMVPVAFDPEELPKVELIELAVMAVPAAPVEGPAAVTVGVALATTVSDIPDPQVEMALLLLESPT